MTFNSPNKQTPRNAGSNPVRDEIGMRYLAPLNKVLLVVIAYVDPALNGYRQTLLDCLDK